MASPSKSRPIPSMSPPHRGLSPAGESVARSASNARLASPVPSDPRTHKPSQANSGSSNTTPLPGLDGPSESRSYGQPGTSALATALNASLRGTSPRAQERGRDTAVDRRRTSQADRIAVTSQVGSFGQGSFRSHRSSRGQSPSKEDFDVVRRHLVGSGPASSLPTNNLTRQTEGQKRATNAQGTSLGAFADTSDIPDLSEGFSSLQMQGGDVHRGIYRRTEAEQAGKRRRAQRSYSVEIPRHEADEMYAEQILEPGGFRREHILRNNPSSAADTNKTSRVAPSSQPNFIANNFFEFLTMYGHFAGEDYQEDEEDSEPVSEAATLQDEDQVHYARDDERRPLLQRQPSTKRKRKEGPKSGTGGTVLILLKSFVGTGVLFLPRAFLNGGMAFSIGILLAVASVSYYCFILLTTSRLALKSSYAEMGEIVYGKWLRFLINTSLVISQIGFASAYIVFTSENLQAFILAVSPDKTFIDIKLMILMQLVAFLPLSLYRNLNSLSFVVYIADFFILLGILYLYYYGISTIADQHGVADINNFNEHGWTLFIGTAIFTFEGIGLIIPIQDGMKRPEKLPSILFLVMCIITFIFISMGAVSYAAYGSATQTVIIKNMRQDNKFVNAVQFIYSLAILLSTPMQIFPAITILEKGIFSRSGKYSKNVKWGKNAFRFMMVIVCALIAWIGANDLDKFVALVGSFACIPLVYIYPPLIHRRAVSSETWRSFLDVLLCLMGFVLMAYTSTLTVVSWIGGTKSLHSQPG